MIRTAYAVESGCTVELADALACWLAAYTDFPGRTAAPGLSPRDTIDSVIAHFGARPAFAGNIVDRMAGAADDAFFGQHAGPLPFLALDAIRQQVLALYARYDDFALLHAVTATHAMRVLQPFWGDERSACAHLWQGILLAVASAAPDLASHPSRARADLPDAHWDFIFAQACDSMDDHTVKLIYTAHQEFLFDGRSLYRQVAARKAGF